MHQLWHMLMEGCDSLDVGRDNLNWVEEVRTCRLLAMTSFAAASATLLPPTSTSCSATATAWHPADRSRRSWNSGDPLGRCSFTFHVMVRQSTSRRTARSGAMAAYPVLHRDEGRNTQQRADVVCTGSPYVGFCLTR